MSEFSLGVAPTALYLDNDALEDTYYSTAGIQKKKKEVEVEAVKGGEEGGKKGKDEENEDGSSASKGKLPYPTLPYVATHYFIRFASCHRPALLSSTPTLATLSFPISTSHVLIHLSILLSIDQALDACQLLTWVWVCPLLHCSLETTGALELYRCFTSILIILHSSILLLCCFNSSCGHMLILLAHAGFHYLLLCLSLQLCSGVRLIVCTSTSFFLC